VNPNLAGLLVGLATLAIGGFCGWFCKHFMVWPFGEARHPEARATVHVGQRLTHLEGDVATLRSEVSKLSDNLGQARAERVEGQREVLEAVRDHALLSAENLGAMRQDIGNLFGLLGLRPPGRRMRLSKAPRPRQQKRTP